MSLIDKLRQKKGLIQKLRQGNETRQGNTGGVTGGREALPVSGQPRLGTSQAPPQRLDTGGLQHLADRGTRPDIADAGSRFEAASGVVSEGVDRPS